MFHVEHFDRRSPGRSVDLGLFDLKCRAIYEKSLYDSHKYLILVDLGIAGSGNVPRGTFLSVVLV
jgi:hypothetical protein